MNLLGVLTIASVMALPVFAQTAEVARPAAADSGTAAADSGTAAANSGTALANSGTEQAELDRAVGEAGSSPVDVIRALEKHLNKYPESKHRSAIEKALTL